MQWLHHHVCCVFALQIFYQKTRFLFASLPSAWQTSPFPPEEQQQQQRFHSSSACCSWLWLKGPLSPPSGWEGKGFGSQVPSLKEKKRIDRAWREDCVDDDQSATVRETFPLYCEECVSWALVASGAWYAIEDLMWGGTHMCLLPRGWHFSFVTPVARGIMTIAYEYVLFCFFSLFS